MSSYNQELNSNPDYKARLVYALVNGSSLPAFSGRESGEVDNVSDDELLALFSRRDFSDVGRVMALQYGRFGPIDERLFWSIIKYVYDSAAGKKIEGLPSLPDAFLDSVTFIPSNDLFSELCNIHREYHKGLINYIESIVPEGVGSFSNRELLDIFNKVLTHEKLDSAGWVAASNERTNFISIAKLKKQILVGTEEVRYSRSRLIGLLIHEIEIHVKWAERYVSDRPVGLEEGVGMLMEQLQLNKFHPLRFYRFLAICFAIGLDGKKRCITEVYELLLNIRWALKPNEEKEKSKFFVAKEVTRVYRNLPLDKPGLVYIRDKQYLEYNAGIWGGLRKQTPSPEDYEHLVSPWRKKS